MLAYAANAPRHAERKSNPNAMLAIIAGHVALLAVVMSARMDLPIHHKVKPIQIITIDPVKPPPPNPIPHADPRPQPGLTVPLPPTPLPPLPGPDLAPSSDATNPGSFGGSVGSSLPDPVSMPAVVRSGPELLTPPSELRPPYPPAKLAGGEEALLKLRLTIDERGRVVSVDPIGRADAVFLSSARRYLLAHWRYKPAIENNRAVTSTIVIILRFQLDG